IFNEEEPIPQLPEGALLDLMNPLPGATAISGNFVVRHADAAGHMRPGDRKAEIEFLFLRTGSNVTLVIHEIPFCSCSGSRVGCVSAASPEEARKAKARTPRREDLGSRRPPFLRNEML